MDLQISNAPSMQVVYDDRSSASKLQQEIEQNTEIIPIREPQTQTTSDTKLQDWSTQATSEYNQAKPFYGRAADDLRSMSMTKTDPEKLRKNGEKVAEFLVKAFDEKCLDAPIIAKVFIERTGEVSAEVKSTVRSTIAHSMIELVKLEKNELAADIISQMVEQGCLEDATSLEDATRILTCVEHKTNSKDAKDVSNITKNIVLNMADKAIEKIQIAKCGCKHWAAAEKRLKNKLKKVSMR